MRLLKALALVAMSWPAATLAALEGRVESADGKPVERAKVTAVLSGENTAASRAFSDAEGRFEIDCEIPCLLLAEHPRFEQATLEINTTPTARVLLALAPKQSFDEEIVVTAGRGVGDSYQPVSVATTAIHVDERAAPPSTLTELVEGIAGVAENGQGGIFQVFSIRGVSRQRVMTLVAGMQIISERRAGTSASFIDPLLLGATEVLRGPSSTYYGSGALGGVIQMFPAERQGRSFESGYSSSGDETYQALGWSGGEWSLGLAHRQANNSEAVDGTVRNSHFEQVSATLARSWQRGNRDYRLLVIPTYGDDIGKSNSDFPDRRVTNYPRERHLLVRFSLADADGWSLAAYVHPNDLTTDVLRPGSRRNTIENRAFDVGADWQRRFKIGPKVAGRFGIDYFGRHGVSAADTEERFDSGARTVVRGLDGGEQNELAAYGTLRWGWGAATLEAGARLTFQQQNNSGFSSGEDQALTGFAGLVYPFGKGFELTANLGTGLRFATLSERFFTGTTGRGGVIGNPDLDPERSLNADLGLRWYGDRTFFSTQVFRLEIDDYIERIELEPNLLTFVNLLSGTIEGFEVEGFFRPLERWTISWSGHSLNGRADGGQALADIPSDRLRISLRHDRDRWRGQLAWQYRASKNDPGNGELTTLSAQLVSSSLRYQLNHRLAVSLSAKNLLDETYRASADDKATLSPGRSVGLALSWSAGAP